MQKPLEVEKEDPLLLSFFQNVQFHGEHAKNALAKRRAKKNNQCQKAMPTSTAARVGGLMRTRHPHLLLMMHHDQQVTRNGCSLNFVANYQWKTATIINIYQPSFTNSIVPGPKKVSNGSTKHGRPIGCLKPQSTRGIFQEVTAIH